MPVYNGEKYVEKIFNILEHNDKVTEIYDMIIEKLRREIMADAKILATIERSDTEQLQISVSEYKGRSYLNMRIFYTTDEGATWLPTKKGVTFSPDQLDLLTEAIEEARQEFMATEG